jgi:hypothetical protein
MPNPRNPKFHPYIQTLSQDPSLENWIRCLTQIRDCQRGISINMVLGTYPYPSRKIAVNILEARDSASPYPHPPTVTLCFYPQLDFHANIDGRLEPRSYCDKELWTRPTLRPSPTSAAAPPSPSTHPLPVHLL